MKVIFDTDELIPISFRDALEYYKLGVLIECHIENEEGVVVEWEKYHIAHGLLIALEFNEIINGKWYVDRKSKNFIENRL